MIDTFDKEFHYAPLIPSYVNTDGSVRFDKRKVLRVVGDGVTNRFESMKSANECFRQKMGDEEFHKKSLIILNRYFKDYINTRITEPHKIQIINSLYQKLVQVPYSGLSKNPKIKISNIGLKMKTISFCDIVERLDENQWKCEYSGIPFDTNMRHLCPSIDRLDSMKGYVKGNIAIVLTCLNMAKSTLTLDEFKKCVECIASGSIIETINYGKYSFSRNTLPNNVNKSISLDVPLQMKSQEAKLFYEFRDRDWFLWKDAVRDLGLKEVSRQRLKRLQGDGYLQRLGEGTKMNPYSYKFKTREEIIAVNENKTFMCAVCCECVSVKYARPRKTRQANATYDGNFYHTLCRKCSVSATMKFKKKDFATYLWAKIRSRNDKRGNINKDNIHLIISDRCTISGVPLCMSHDEGATFNTISPDRKDSSGKYDIDNTRCICLMLNLMRKDYDISDDEMMNIIKKCSNNLNKK